MRMFQVRRSEKARDQHRSVRCGMSVETLELRTFLNATLTSQIPEVTVAKDSAPTTIALGSHFKDPLVTGTAVVLHTTQGDIPLNLFDSKTPQTVQNFLSYVESGEYNGTVLQRAIPNFILQGGQFLPDQSQIPTGNPVPSEASIANTTGTIAMALSNGPDSATSAWFINMGNNSSTLDSSSDGGPFTVFGQVIYNGMNVANQIVNLPKGQVSPNFIPFSGDPSGGVLPLQNYSGSTITTANYVTLPSVQEVPGGLAYTVASDNASLVTPTVSNGTLTLNYASGQTGIAHVTVTATDFGGHSVTNTFVAAVGSVLGQGGAKQIRFTDTDGTRTTLALTGPGNADVAFNGSGVTESLSKAGVLTVSGTGLSIASIVLTGTSAATTLNVTGVGGNNLVEIGSISSSADLRTINASRAATSGDITIDGSISRIQLASATGGTIAVAGSSGALALVIGSATGEAVNSSEAIASVQSTTWAASTDGSSPAFSAPSLGRVAVNRELNANFTTGSIANVNAGSITASTWNVSGAVTTLSAGSITGLDLAAGSVGRVTDHGAATDVTVNSAADISAFNAQSLVGSRIEAGAPTLDANGLATAFPTPATISSVVIGSGGFSNSAISASSLGNVNLGSLASSNNGSPFGVAAHAIRLLVAIVDGKHLVVRNAASASDVTAALTKAGVTPNDLVIRIV